MNGDLPAIISEAIPVAFLIPPVISHGELLRFCNLILSQSLDMCTLPMMWCDEQCRK